MKDDHNNGENSEEQLEFGPADKWPPRSGPFNDLDENEQFEEPDRDSDYASMFTEVEEEEADFMDEIEDQPDSVKAAAEPSLWAEDAPQEDPLQQDSLQQDSLQQDSLQQDSHQQDSYEEEDSYEEDAYGEEEEREITLPLGIIVVGIIALALLGAGGYGVMHDRAALQEEIRQLHSSLATSASPEEVAETRAAAATLASRNRELEQQAADLSRENRSLQAIVAGLETQLQIQQEALAKAQTPAPAPAPAPAPKKAAPKPAPKPQVSSTAATPAAGTWFVNFGSYILRNTAAAWAERLKPGAGDVIVSTGEKDGRTFYRVRVINLANQEAANSTARKLEQDYDLSRLWVGQSR